MFDLPDTSVDHIAFTVVTTGDQQTITYPASRGPWNYSNTGDHKVTGRDFSELSYKLGHISLTFGASSVIVTNNTDRTFKAGTVIYLHLDRSGYNVDDDQFPAVVDGYDVKTVQVNLGTPITADADGFCASQNLTALGVFSVSVTAAAAIAAAALVGDAGLTGRNVVAAWTGTAVLTVTGTDIDGNVIHESSASGATFTGKKAFKTVTGIAVSADVTALTVGTGVILGIPVFVKATGHIIAEFQDGAAASAGTKVAGVTTTATATTGDTKGTVAPANAPNGSRQYELTITLASRSYRGVTQF